MRSLRLASLMAFSATITSLFGCGGGATGDKPSTPTSPGPNAVASVSIAGTSALLVPGTTLQLTATLRDAGGNSLVGRTVTWSSADPAVAIVSATGLVSAVAKGSAAINAMSEGVAGAITVTVAEPVASVSVTRPSASLLPRSALQLTATLRDSSGATLTGRTVTWSSAAPTVATVSATGLVTAVASGSATISATSEGVTGTSTVAVAVNAALTIDSPFSLERRDTRTLSVTVRDSAGAVLTGRTVAFSVAPAAVATISAAGVITAQSVGTAVVTAAFDGASASTTVTVIPAASTVVLRVVGTDPTWGQDPANPGWPAATPVKDSIRYSLYDLEIGWNSNLSDRRVSYLATYKFSDSLPLTSMTAARHTASRIQSTTVSGSNYTAQSASLLAAFKAAIPKIMERERPTRIILEYSGHGAPWAFFAGAMKFPDARELMKAIRQAAPGVPLVLDFSTNCDVAYVDFAVNFYDVADYLIASDLNVGGFSVPDFAGVLAFHHDPNLHRFYAHANDLNAVFTTLVNSRQNYWNAQQAGLRAAETAGDSHAQQSLAVFDLAKFIPFMTALARDGSFTTASASTYASDIGTYVGRSNDALLQQSFQAFQIRYVSTRGIVTWQTDTRGFGFIDAAALNTLLASLR